MSYISSSYFVCGADGDGAAGTGFWTEVSLFLDYDYYSITYGGGEVSLLIPGRGRDW